VPAATAVRRAPDEQASDQARTGAIRSASITTEAGNINPASAAAPASGLMRPRPVPTLRSIDPSGRSAARSPARAATRARASRTVAGHILQTVRRSAGRAGVAAGGRARGRSAGFRAHAGYRTGGYPARPVGELVSGLADRGFRADTWQPLAGTGRWRCDRAGSAAPGSRTGQDLNGDPGRGFRGEGNPAGQQQQQQRREPDREELSWLQALTRSSARGGSSNYDYTD